MKINKQQLIEMVLARVKEIPAKEPLSPLESGLVKKSILEAAAKKEDNKELQELEQRAKFYQEVLDNIYSPEKAREMLDFINKKIENIKSKKK